MNRKCITRFVDLVKWLGSSWPAGPCGWLLGLLKRASCIQACGRRQTKVDALALIFTSMGFDMFWLHTCMTLCTLACCSVKKGANPKAPFSDKDPEPGCSAHISLPAPSSLTTDHRALAPKKQLMSPGTGGLRIWHVAQGVRWRLSALQQLKAGRICGAGSPALLHWAVFKMLDMVISIHVYSFLKLSRDSLKKLDHFFKAGVLQPRHLNHHQCGDHCSWCSLPPIRISSNIKYLFWWSSWSPCQGMISRASWKPVGDSSIKLKEEGIFSDSLVMKQASERWELGKAV